MIVSMWVLLVGVYLALSLWWLAPQKPGYRHMQHTISELGEQGSVLQYRVAFGLFLPVGLCLLPSAVLLHSASQSVAGLALAIAIGYLGAAFFPCDPGSPASGTLRQGIHNLAGAVEYLGGGLALMVTAEDLGKPFQILGLVVFAAAFGLTVLPGTTLRGLVQRIAETALFGGLAWSIWLVQT